MSVLNSCTYNIHTYVVLSWTMLFMCGILRIDSLTTSSAAQQLNTVWQIWNHLSGKTAVNSTLNGLKMFWLTLCGFVWWDNEHAAIALRHKIIELIEVLVCMCVFVPFFYPRSILHNCIHPFLPFIFPFMPFFLCLSLCVCIHCIFNIVCSWFLSSVWNCIKYSHICKNISVRFLFIFLYCLIGPFF